MAEDEELDKPSDPKEPGWRFLVRMLVKGLGPIAVTLAGSIGGAVTAYVGWQYQGRAQALDEARHEAQQQVLLLDKLRSYIETHEDEATAAVADDDIKKLLEAFKAQLSEEGAENADEYMEQVQAVPAEFVRDAVLKGKQ